MAPKKKKSTARKSTAAKKTTARKSPAAKKTTAKKTTARKTTAAKSSLGDIKYRSVDEVPVKVQKQIQKLRKEGKSWLEVRQATGVRRPIARQFVEEESSGTSKKKSSAKKTSAKKKKTTGRGTRKGASSTNPESKTTVKKRKGKKKSPSKTTGRGSKKTKTRNVEDTYFDADEDIETIIETVTDNTVVYVKPDQTMEKIQVKRAKKMKDSEKFGTLLSLWDQHQKIHAIPVQFIIDVE